MFLVCMFSFFDFLFGFGFFLCFTCVLFIFVLCFIFERQSILMQISGLK